MRTAQRANSTWYSMTPSGFSKRDNGAEVTAGALPAHVTGQTANLARPPPCTEEVDLAEYEEAEHGNEQQGQQIGGVQRREAKRL